MAETLVRFQTPVCWAGGIPFQARACAAEAPDGLWHAWIEFTPMGGGRTIRSGRETTQPNRRDAQYWATGLTTVYLEGALRRALEGPVPLEALRSTLPAFRKPSPATTYSAMPGHGSPFDPFSVYAKGELLLRRQLRALSEWHLVNIAVAHNLTDEPVDSLSRRRTSYLIELIVSGVRQRRTGPRQPGR